MSETMIRDDPDEFAMYEGQFDHLTGEAYCRALLLSEDTKPQGIPPEGITVTFSTRRSVGSTATLGTIHHGV